MNLPLIKLEELLPTPSEQACIHLRLRCSLCSGLMCDMCGQGEETYWFALNIQEIRTAIEYLICYGTDNCKEENPLWNLK